MVEDMDLLTARPRIKNRPFLAHPGSVSAVGAIALLLFACVPNGASLAMVWLFGAFVFAALGDAAREWARRDAEEAEEGLESEGRAFEEPTEAVPDPEDEAVFDQEAVSDPEAEPQR